MWPCMAAIASVSAVLLLSNELCCISFLQTVFCHLVFWYVKMFLISEQKVRCKVFVCVCLCKYRYLDSMLVLLW